MTTEASLTDARWTTFAFADVVRLSRERSASPEDDGLDRYVGLEHLEPDELTIRRWGDIADGTTFTTVFRPGQVLFGKRRAYQRKVAVADFSGVCSGDIYVLESINPDVLLPELLPFICQSEDFLDHAVGTSAGSLSPRTNWKSLATYELALPRSETQSRVAEAFLAAERHIDALLRLRDQLVVVRASALQALTFGLELEMSPVGQHCRMQNGRAFPGRDYCDDGERLLRPGNMDSSGYLVWTEDNTEHLPRHYRESAQEYVVEAGDVLINLTAQSLEDGFMGRVCVAREGDDSLLNQRIGRFTQFSARLEPEYLFRVLQSSNFQQHAIGMCEGSKVKHLFWEHISRFEIPLPSIEHQFTVINELRSLDEALNAAEERLGSARHLKKRMLRSLLRTPEDSEK